MNWIKRLTIIWIVTVDLLQGLTCQKSALMCLSSRFLTESVFCDTAESNMQISLKNLYHAHYVAWSYILVAHGA